jgi:hypothetical protein
MGQQYQNGLVFGTWEGRLERERRVGPAALGSFSGSGDKVGSSGRAVPDSSRIKGAGSGPQDSEGKKIGFGMAQQLEHVGPNVEGRML